MERLTQIIYNNKEEINEIVFNPQTVEPHELHKVKQKLYDYETAEEQGLLIKLPCKEGTTVYQILWNPFTEEYYIDNPKFSLFLHQLNFFNKSWFLTMVEAQSMLLRKGKKETKL